MNFSCSVWVDNEEYSVDGDVYDGTIDIESIVDEEGKNIVKSCSNAFYRLVLDETIDWVFRNEDLIQTYRSRY